MIHGVHIEVILACGYALFLVGVAVVLEYLARHSHHRSEHYRNSGFVYKHKLDVWECPTGHHLERTHADFEQRIAHYRAPAHKCNCCHIKKNCTDSDDGRHLESRVDSWLESELRRFHRGISLSLLLLAMLILGTEIMRHDKMREWLILAALLAPIAYAGSKLSVSFWERERKN